MVFDVAPSFDIGPNLTSLFIAVIAAISSLLAAYFAHKSSATSTATQVKVDGRMTEMLKAKDDLVTAANTATAFAQGVAIQPSNGNAPTVDTTHPTDTPKG